MTHIGCGGKAIVMIGFNCIMRWASENHIPLYLCLKCEKELCSEEVE